MNYKKANVEKINLNSKKSQTNNSTFKCLKVNNTLNSLNKTFNFSASKSVENE